MKLLKRTAVIIWICLLVFLAGYTRLESGKTVIAGEEPFVDVLTWGPMVSKDVNRQPVNIYAADKELRYTGYMEEDMELMIPVQDIRDAFLCSAFLYDNTKLVLQKRDTRLEFLLDENSYSINGETTVNTVGMKCVDGVFYVPASILGKHFMCDLTWDIKSHTLWITNQWEGSIVPSAYSMQKDGRNTPVKNQGNLGTCWAAAAVGAVETALRPAENLIFSTDHMSIRNSFSTTQNDGGEYTMAMAYLLAWQGPVLEDDDPYGDNQSPQNLKPVRHVQEIQLIKEKNIEKIKEAVFLYGAVETSIYTSLRSSASRSVYYDYKKAAYCYTGADIPNHDIIIIGWDDSYSKDNFNMKVEGDGAFICQNSWGTGFGNQGIFYISYYDSNIGSQSVFYSRVESVDNFDCIYQTDLCGWNGQLGYNRDSAFFSNVFQTQSRERIKAVGFYATDKDTSYEIFAVSDFTDKSSLNERVLLQSGRFDNAGFYTVDLEKEFVAEAGRRFAIVIKITTPNSVHPIAVEYRSDERTKKADLSDGEGYISIHGADWTSTESEQSCNVCMKIYTDKEE